MNATLKKYLKSSLTGLIIAFIIMVLKGIFKAVSNYEILRAVCDGFFVSGVLLICFGLLIFSSNMGTFDMISYGVRQVVRIIVPSRFEKQSFYDYRAEKQKKQKAFLPMIFCGIGEVIIAGLILLIFL